MTSTRSPRRHRRRGALAALLIAVALTALLASAPPAVASGAAPPPPKTVTVPISNDAFAPADLMVNVGDTVTWTNADEVPHDVTSTQAPAAFSSGPLGPGASFSYTFATAGTYRYVCTAHPGMAGSVTAVPLPTHAAVPAAPAPPVDAAAAPPAAASAAAPASGAATMASGAEQGSGLDPVLVIAGIVLGVAALGLILIGTQPSHRRRLSTRRPGTRRPSTHRHRAQRGRTARHTVTRPAARAGRAGSRSRGGSRG